MVFDLYDGFIEDFGDDAFDLSRRDAFGGVVDGAEALAVGFGFVVIGEDFVEGVCHLEHGPAAGGFALDPEAVAGEDGCGEEGLPEPDEVEAAGFVHEDGFEALLSPSPCDAGGGDLATGGGHGAGFELGDDGFGAFVFVAVGEVCDEAAEVGEGEFGECLGAFRADAREELDGGCERTRLGWVRGGGGGHPPSPRGLSWGGPSSPGAMSSGLFCSGSRVRR